MSSPLNEVRNSNLNRLPRLFKITCPLYNNYQQAICVNKDETIPVIVVSIVSNQLDFQYLSSTTSTVYKGGETVINLKLLKDKDDLEVFDTLEGLTQIQSSFGIDGVSFFTKLSINKVGIFRIIATSNNPTIKDTEIFIKVSDNKSKLSINKIYGSLKILKNNQSLYLFDIVDNDNKHLENLDKSLPDLLVQTFFFKWLSQTGDYQIGPKTYLSPETNGIYNKILIPNQVGTYLIHLSPYYSHELINNYFFYLYVLENDNAHEQDKGVYNLEMSYYLLESIYLNKKIANNNYLHKSLPIKKKFKFETGLTSSENISYKIKNPQEHSSIPHHVDNSKGTVDPTIPWFNPRLKPSFQYGKKMNKANKITTELILNNQKARGLNSGSLTNMIIEITKAKGPNNYVISDALTNTDIILKNITNAFKYNKADPLQDNILRFKPIKNKMDMIPVFPKAASTIGSSSSETFYQKYRIILPGCGC